MCKIVEATVKPLPLLGQRSAFTDGGDTRANGPVTPQLFAQPNSIIDIPQDVAANLLALLSEIAWHPSGRQQVKGKGVCIGLRWTTRGAVVESLEGQALPLMKVANNFLARTCVFPAFAWSSLQVSCDTVSDTQSVQNGRDDSVMLVMGHFQGGEFVLDSKQISLRNQALRFDRSLLHSSLPFSDGHRFSIIAFVHPAWGYVNSSQRAELVELGFITPEVVERGLVPLIMDPGLKLPASSASAITAVHLRGLYLFVGTLRRVNIQHFLQAFCKQRNLGVAFRGS